MTPIESLAYRAEFLGQRFTAASFIAAVYRDGRMWPVYIRMQLIPGYSSRDHLYDLAIRRVAAELQRQPCDTSLSTLRRRLERAAGGRDGASDWQFTLDDCPIGGPRDPMLARIGITWEEVDAILRAQWQREQKKQNRKFARSGLARLERLSIMPYRDGYIVSDRDHGRPPLVSGLAATEDVPLMFTSPAPVYPTPEAAQAAIAAVRQRLQRHLADADDDED